MTPTRPCPAPSRAETLLTLLLFIAACGFHAWAGHVGWESKNLPGMEFRQAQTALSTYFIRQDGHFRLDYPTPVLGKPWSVPMEFPLYQWTVVVTSRVTGLGLTKAGRAVSLACFYLSLPALYLLLARWGVAPVRRLVVLALFLTCPLTIFYGRAVLIETMALMFALWFCVAYERGVVARDWRWLFVAILAGSGAGLAKVTTYLLYLIPTGLWSLRRLWSGQREGTWRRELAWMIGAVAIPFAAALTWVWYADMVKARNPMAEFLSSANLHDFNLGTVAMRLSPELWQLKWRLVTQVVTWWPGLLGTAILLPLGARHRTGAVLACAGLFGAALVVFPALYAYHDYYYVANTAALLLAVGLVLVGLYESGVARKWAPLAAAVLVAGQAYWYLERDYPAQRAISPGGNGLTAALRELTRADEVLVILGQDWNSMMPYYAQRRALMLHHETPRDLARVEQALGNLAGEKIGALVITGGNWQDWPEIIRRLQKLGLAAEPWLKWSDSWVFLPQSRREEFVSTLRHHYYEGVNWAPGTEPEPEAMGGKWHSLEEVPDHLRYLFQTMQPLPVRFFSTYEPVQQEIEHVPSYGAHPVTRLVFRLAAGPHRLSTQVWFNPGAYTVPQEQGPTDGVEITLSALRQGGVPVVLASRLVDPTHVVKDRGAVPLSWDFTLQQEGEVELSFGPGPRNDSNHDWIWIRGPLTFR